MTQAKLQQVREALKERFIERDVIVDGMLVALLSRQHVLLLGPPGTAKSMLARQVCSAVDGAMYFEWLLTKFSTPEELFGPVSLRALEEGRYERLTARKLPESSVAFLDEVFKANSAILNALLTIMNERQFHDGSAVRSVPLETLVAAANELPDLDELAALYDRFLLRFSVGYLEQDDAVRRLLTLSDQGEAVPRLSADELATLQSRVPSVEVPRAVVADVVEIRKKLAREGVVPSDRRYRQGLAVLRAAAVLDDRRQVQTSDLSWLRHVLWTDPEDQAKVNEVLGQVATGFDEDARRLADQAKEIYSYALRHWPDETSKARAALEAHTKLHDIERRLDHLIAAAEERERDTEGLKSLKGQIARLQVDLLGAGH